MVQQMRDNLTVCQWEVASPHVFLYVGCHIRTTGPTIKEYWTCHLPHPRCSQHELRLQAACLEPSTTENIPELNVE
jgi:hypothetical protein